MMVQDNTISRRNALRAIGVTAASGIGISSAKAERSDARPTDPTYEKAKEILEQQGRDAYEEYIRSNNALVSKKSAVVTQGENRFQREDGISTESLTCVEPDDNCDLEMKVNLYLNNYPLVNYVAAIVVEYQYQVVMVNPFYSAGGPDSIKDAIGFGWDPTSWDIRNPDNPASCMGAPVYGDWDGGSYNRTNRAGSLFEVQPATTVENEASEKDSTGTYWADATARVILEKQPDYSSGDEISGLVRHTWGDVNHNFSFSISVGLTGPSVGIGYSSYVQVNEEDIGNDPSGQILRVSD